MGTRPVIAAGKDFYKILNPSYQSLPYFIPPQKVEGIEILEKNWKIFRDELEDFRTKGMTEHLSSNRTAHKYQPQGWKTTTLLTYGYKYHKKCKYFPKTVSILEKIPGISLISLNIMAPNAEIKGHKGDSNAIYRCSLGLIIPEGLPRCGLRVGTEERSWEEGKVLVFDDANRHRAWNNTDKYRVVIVVDIFKPEYRDRKWSICGRVWASFLMIHLAARIPVLKKTPNILTISILHLIGFTMSILLRLQRRLKFELPIIS